MWEDILSDFPLDVDAFGGAEVILGTVLLVPNDRQTCRQRTVLRKSSVHPPKLESRARLWL